MDTFLQLFVRSFETGSIYALATLGIIIIFRTSHITNFALGSMGMFCTYFATWIISAAGVSIYVSALCSVVIAITIGILVDFFVIRRAIHVSPLAKQIITLGLLMIFLGITPMIFGIELLSLPKMITQGSISISNASLSYNGLLNIVIGLSIMAVLFYVLQKTKLGLAIRTTASDETTSRMLGINTKGVTMFSWALASALSCLAGIMIAPSTTVTLTLLDSVQITAFVACIFGGFQTFYGPIIGAYIIGICRNMLLYYVSSVWGEQILYILVFIFIIFRPHGLIGKKVVKKV